MKLNKNFMTYLPDQKIILDCSSKRKLQCHNWTCSKHEHRQHSKEARIFWNEFDLKFIFGQFNGLFIWKEQNPADSLFVSWQRNSQRE